MTKKLLVLFLGCLLATNAYATFSGGPGFAYDFQGNGISSTGISGSNYLDVFGAASGAVTPGTAATYSSLAGMVFNSSYPAPSAGQQLALQSDSQGRLLVNSFAGFPTVATYVSVASGIVPAATATDIWTITGSSSHAVRIESIRIYASATTPALKVLQLVKRSTADTGGTSTNPTIVPYDSGDSVASAVVAQYSANPSALGTSVGNISYDRAFIPAVPAQVINYMYGDSGTYKPVTLHGTSENLALNLNGASVTGGSFDVVVVWTEM